MLTSAHPLPIEYLRRKGINRDNRLCTLCSSHEISTEMHLLCYCNNDILTTYQSDLLQKLIELNSQWSKLKISNIIGLLLLSNDMQATFFFGIFLQRLFKLIKDSYSTKD